MTTASYKINDSLFLVQAQVPGLDSVPPVPSNTHHIFCIDCSWSMSGDLPKLREQAKQKLVTSLREGDSFSLIWFSGQGECGIVLEGETVETARDLQRVHGVIDRWLKPVGLTGFQEPIALAGEVAQRLSKKGGGAIVFTMMTDGYNNQGPRAEVLSEMERTSPFFSSSTFVEYGYYSDRPLLTDLAERAGGVLVFSENFNQYEVVVDKLLSKKMVGGGKRIEVGLPNADFIGGFAFAMDQEDLLTFKIEGNKITVPEGMNEVFFLSPSLVGKKAANDIEYVSKVCWETPMNSGAASPSYFDAVYAAISLFATRMKADIVRPLLKASGDVALIEQFANCFGKQAYSEFMDMAKAAAFKAGGRFTTGWDPNKVPKDDAFTVLGMLRLLASDDENKMFFNHDRFAYSAIGRGRVDANTVLTKEDHAEIANLTKQLESLNDPSEALKISARIKEITDKPPALKFVVDESQADAGYAISNLTYNENRPNVSILVNKNGTIDLSALKDKPAGVPDSIETSIFRNYTIIKDGLVNVKTLPVKVSADTKANLENLVADGDIPLGAIQVEDDVHLIHLNMLPIINALMVKDTSAKVLFEAHYAMLQAKARQKVYNTFKKDNIEATVTESFAKLYGDDGALWLKEIGITDRGFSPKSVQGDATDYYMSKELKVKMKGLSSLPTVKKVQEAVAKGKVTPSAALMTASVSDAENFLSANPSEDKVIEFLDAKALDARTDARHHAFIVAQTKFAVLVGQTWFTEFASIDDNSMEVTMPDGNVVQCKVEMLEKKINI